MPLVTSMVNERSLSASIVALKTISLTSVPSRLTKTRSTKLWLIGALAAADLDEAEAEDADAAAEEVVADVAEAMVGLSPVVMLPELTMMDFR
jgi:thiamine biosynthesis lipoprotein ApbE